MAAAAFVALAVGAAASAAPATGERILFQSDRDSASPGPRGPESTGERVTGGNWELYAMNADGSSPIRLTFDPLDDVDPTTPASGARIAFARGQFTAVAPSFDGDLTDGDRIRVRTDKADIYVMRADGSKVKRLTRDGANSSPSFSPDGSKIAFASFREQDSDIRLDIDVMNADGSGRVSLTAGSGYDEWDPAWSPDGSKIAFARSDPAAFSPDIYVMNADGSAPAQVTSGRDPDYAPAWSPDGTRIVFHGERYVRALGGEAILGDDSEVFVINVNADGSGSGEETQLTDTPPRHPNWDTQTDPSWSPDGTRIAFTPPSGFGQEIYVMNADGSNPRALTSNTAGDSDPAFARVRKPVEGAEGVSAPASVDEVIEEAQEVVEETVEDVEDVVEDVTETVGGGLPD